MTPGNLFAVARLSACLTTCGLFRISSSDVPGRIQNLVVLFFFPTHAPPYIDLAFGRGLPKSDSAVRRGNFRKRPTPREFFSPGQLREREFASSCSRDMPLQGPVHSQYKRCRPSRRGDDVRVSLAEKQPFRRRKTGMGVRCR